MGTKNRASRKPFTLKGFDEFSQEPYPLRGEFRTETEAVRAALAELRGLERAQPSKQSGGQGKYGIQDRVYIVYPDGRERRIFPKLGKDYRNLERHLSGLRTTMPYRQLRLAVIISYARAGLAGLPRESLLGGVLGIDKRSKERSMVELMELVNRVLEPLDMVLGVGNIMLGVALNFGNQRERKQCVATLAEKLSNEIDASLRDVADSTNLRAVIVYPLILSSIEMWRGASPELVDKVVNTLRDRERDVLLKALITEMDLPFQGPDFGLRH